jgi:hypothetical protein
LCYIGNEYEKQDQQGKAAFNERNPDITKQHMASLCLLEKEWWAPTLNAEQSIEDENITTLIACTGRLFTTATRTKQNGCEYEI